MAYDAARQQVVLFGGLTASGGASDTWVWDGINWTQKSLLNSPKPRMWHAMAYDAAREQVVLFAGRGLNEDGSATYYDNDTWVWDGVNWTQKEPANAPPFRFGHAMAYDAAREEVLLSGGRGFNENGSKTYYNDSWVWNGTNWSVKGPANQPSQRDYHSMAYDAARQQVVLFGGWNGFSESNDIWVWDGANWMQESPANSPTSRAFHAMAYDAAHERVVLFGGNYGSAVFNDTWVWPDTPGPVLPCVVGTGTTVSCTESALDACLPGDGSFDGAVTFNCGGAATITVTSTKTISADTAIDGGSLVTIGGGNSVGIFFVNTGVRFMVQNLTIANARNNARGSGISSSGTLTVTNSTFSGNSARDDGGGIFSSGTLTVSNSTFSGNSARGRPVFGGTFSGGYGGAIFSSGTLTVTNSTFSDNSANQGGGVFNAGVLTVTNSTFSGNVGRHGGGGIYNDSGTVIIANTILANSTSGANCFGAVTDGGHNIDDEDTCGFSAAHDSFTNTNPNLDPAGLAENGGPTATFALCRGPGFPVGCSGASPAINAGDESICSTNSGAVPVNNVDQRGFIRPGPGANNCSIGAFEANSPGPPNPTCATGTLSGYVRDATTWAAKPYISITVGGIATQTDGSGYYSVPTLPPGVYSVSTSVTNFFPYRTNVTVCGDTQHDLLMTKSQTVFGRSAPSGYGPDPVNTATGNYVYGHRDLEIPGRGMPFVFERDYNSQDATDGSLGFGWTHNLNTALLVNPDATVMVRWGDGHTETYTPDGSGGFTPQYGVFDTLTLNGDGMYTLTRKDLTEYQFNNSNQLAAIVDKNGNTVALAYSDGLLTQVTDTAGRVLVLTYDGSDHLTLLTDPIGRTVQFAYDGNDNLVSATDPNGHTTAYTYDADHQILTVTDPRGNVVVTNVYDDQKRVVTSQRDAKGGQTTYSYDTANNVTTITDALGGTTKDYHDPLLRLIRKDDANGHSALYAYDAAGNRTSVTDKNGNTTTYEYDAHGNVTKKTDALGKVTAITYDANNNPLTRTDALSKTTTFTYDTHGNLASTTDALGHVTTIGYDTHGLPQIVTDPRGNTTTNTYDAQGNLTRVTDAIGNHSDYTYDGVGRRLTVTNARGHTTTFTYDANNNPLTTTDARGCVTTYTYDENNNRLSVTDPRGKTTTFTYDAKDLLTILVTRCLA